MKRRSFLQGVFATLASAPVFASRQDKISKSVDELVVKVDARNARHFPRLLTDEDFRLMETYAFDPNSRDHRKKWIGAAEARLQR